MSEKTSKDFEPVLTEVAIEGKPIENKLSEEIKKVDVVVKDVKVDFSDKVCEKPSDWGVTGWIYKSSSDKTLRVVAKDSEGKNKTIGVFFPQQISRLYSGEIKAIPIKYKEKEEKQKEDIEKVEGID